MHIDALIALIVLSNTLNVETTKTFFGEANILNFNLYKTLRNNLLYIYYNLQKLKSQVFRQEKFIFFDICFLLFLKQLLKKIDFYDIM